MLRAERGLHFWPLIFKIVVPAVVDMASKMLTGVLSFTVCKYSSCYIIVSNGRIRTLFFLIKNGKCTENCLSASFMEKKTGQPFLLIHDWEAVGSSGSSSLATTKQIEPPPPCIPGSGKMCSDGPSACDSLGNSS